MDKKKYEIIKSFNKKNVKAGRSKKGYGFTYFAKKNFAKNETIMHGYGRLIDHQTPKISVQIGLKKSYLPSKWTGKYWNHSCDSNAYVRSRQDGFPSLVALKSIKKGEEISYNYAMTEFSWIKEADEIKVTCRCGSKNCKKRILAFSQLSSKDKSTLINRNLCSQYLKHLTI